MTKTAFAGAISISLLFFSCSTARKQTQTEENVILPIDMQALQKELEVDLPADRVGYVEKVFDACGFGPSLPMLRDCHRVYFVLIGFQLSCRDSEEQPNGVLSGPDLKAVENRKLKWKVGSGHSGSVQTDHEGYGEIEILSDHSLRRRDLRLSTGKDFLVTNAGESSNVVTPPSWCE
jgi:hypothetical protein